MSIVEIAEVQSRLNLDEVLHCALNHVGLKCLLSFSHSALEVPRRCKWYNGEQDSGSYGECGDADDKVNV